jgi:hypothetical protein
MWKIFGLSAFCSTKREKKGQLFSVCMENRKGAFIEGKTTKRN